MEEAQTVMEMACCTEKGGRTAACKEDMVVALELVLLQHPALFEIESSVWKKNLDEWGKDFEYITAPAGRREYLKMLQKFVEAKVVEQYGSFCK